MTVDVGFYLTLLPALALIGWGLWLWAVRAGRRRRRDRVPMRPYYPPSVGELRGLANLAANFQRTAEARDAFVFWQTMALQPDPNRKAAYNRWPWRTTDNDWSMEP